MTKNLLLVLFALTLCLPFAKAQEVPDLAGRWEGTIEIPGSPLGVIVKLQNKEGWSGTIDIPAQNNMGVLLQDIRIEGKTVEFAIADIPGEPTFDGTLSGDTLEGTLNQSGQSFPFSLTRRVALSGAERKAALEQGRTFTKLFYGRNFAELHAKSDKTQTGMSRAQLEELWEKVETQLGRETGLKNEVVSRSDDLLTYIRTAAFEKLGLYFAVTWRFTTQGVVKTVSVLPREDIAAPSERLEYKTKTALQLPFDGSWFVFWGGRTVAQNYHAAYPDQRFAYDFFVLKEGSSHKGNGAKLGDYYCFGRPIYAPGAGTVAETVSNLPDLPIGESDPENTLGNHVIIDHGNGEFSFLAHLEQGSISVQPGDKVNADTRLGNCGNSGNTTEPHLHYHMQTDATFYGAAGGEGLPAQFLNYRADGKRVARGEPVKGQKVERLE